MYDDSDLHPFPTRRSSDLGGSSPATVGPAGAFAPWRLSATSEDFRSMPDKSATITEHRLHDTDTGSPEVQIALLRSEEHTSELQSLTNLVCRLLLEKKISS